MVGTVRKEYDFSKARRNPYARRLKRQVTIRLDEETIRYFNGLAAETGIPYQTLINLFFLHLFLLALLAIILLHLRGCRLVCRRRGLGKGCGAEGHTDQHGEYRC